MYARMHARRHTGMRRTHAHTHISNMRTPTLYPDPLTPTHFVLYSWGAYLWVPYTANLSPFYAFSHANPRPLRSSIPFHPTRWTVLNKVRQTSVRRIALDESSAASIREFNKARSTSMLVKANVRKCGASEMVKAAPANSMTSRDDHSDPTYEGVAWY